MNVTPVSVIRSAAAFLILFASMSSAQVRTWVSATGLDANPCTREQPCRNFAAAINAVGIGGEVVAMDSGGYGPVTITKSVTLIAPAGVHAALAPTSGIAITVDAGDNDHVVLRNLFLNGQAGATYGIEVVRVASLHVESCVIQRFRLDGIYFHSARNNSRLYVSRTMVRQTTFGGAGIRISGNPIEGGGSGMQANIDSVRLYDVQDGIEVYLAEVTIRESVVHTRIGLRVITSAYYAGPGSYVMIEDSAAERSAVGFRTNSGVMIVTRCASALNGNQGILAQDNGTVYVSGSTITGSSIAIEADTGGLVLSRGNNTLAGNTSNGTFSTYSPF